MDRKAFCGKIINQHKKSKVNRKEPFGTPLGSPTVSVYCRRNWMAIKETGDSNTETRKESIRG